MATWGIIGLGNPGAKYSSTRHNAGFWTLDLLQQKLGSPSVSEKFGCQFSRTKSDSGDDLVLIRPLQYMNRSGEAAVPLVRYFKVELPNIIAIQDEADLAVGALKGKIGGSSGGHHGIDDLSLHLGSEEFYRVRIGVGRPPGTARDISSWLLSAPAAEDREMLQETTKLAAEMTLAIVQRGLESASQKFARRAFPKGE